MAQGWADAVTHLRAPSRERLTHADVISACAAPDLLCIQELFSRDAQRFFDRLPEPRFKARVRDDNRIHFRTATVRGNGLGIASRWPLVTQRQYHFRAPSIGWDKLARKGALHARVEVAAGVHADVLTCHLQAGYGEAAAAVRAMQLLEVRAFIDEVGSPDRPFIVCGDFNIDGLGAARDLAEYQRLIAALSAFTDLGAAEDLPTFDPHPERNALAHAWDSGSPAQRIDYHFFRPAEGNCAPLACTSIERILDRPLVPAHAPGAGENPRLREHASDHYGLVATFAA